MRSRLKKELIYNTGNCSKNPSDKVLYYHTIYRLSLEGGNAQNTAIEGVTH
jgi:hypothetical protein